MAIHCTRHSKAQRRRCRHELKPTPRKFQDGDRVSAIVWRDNARVRIYGIVEKADWRYFTECPGPHAGPLAGYNQAHWYYHMRYLDQPDARPGTGWAYPEENIEAEVLDALARV